MRSLRLAAGAIVAVAVAACAREPAPQVSTAPTASVAAVEEPPGAVASSASSPGPSAPPPPVGRAASAPPADAGSRVDVAEEIAAGRGSCRADDDCEVSRYQEGCCTGTCSAYATSKADLATRRAKEDCTRPRTCPPPAPCRPQPFDPVRAICKDKKCALVRRLAPPPYDPRQ